MKKIPPHKAKVSAIAPLDVPVLDCETLRKRDELVSQAIKVLRTSFKKRFPHLAISLDRAAQLRIQGSCDMPDMLPWWWDRLEMKLEQHRVSKLSSKVTLKQEGIALAAAQRLLAALRPYDAGDMGKPELVYGLEDFIGAIEFSRSQRNVIGVTETQVLRSSRTSGAPGNSDDPLTIASLGFLWKCAKGRAPAAREGGPFSRFVQACLREISMSMSERVIRKHVETLRKPPYYTQDGKWESAYPPPHEIPQDS